LCIATTKDIYLIIENQPYPGYPSFEGGHQLQQAASRPADDDDEDEPPAAISWRQIKRRIEQCRIEQIEPRNQQLNPKTRCEAKRESICTAQYQLIFFTIQLIA